jgi:outer membrane protein assembly factor BamB
LWSFQFDPRGAIKPAPPIFIAPDLVFVSASYGIGAKVVRLREKEGSIAAELVWKGTQMRNHFNGSVALDGTVYGFDTATLACVDALTGETCWTRRRLGKGSLIAADGMLIILSERGKLVLAEATPRAYTELAAHQVLSGRCWTQPSLWDGQLYLRNHDELVRLDLRHTLSGD